MLFKFSIIGMEFILILITTLHLQLTIVQSESWPLKVTFLHTNDMQARFDETTEDGEKCPQEDVLDRRCYGGFARVSEFVKTTRLHENNVIYLDTGDASHGTALYTVHRWRMLSELIQKIGLDAMSLGKTEFKDGVEDLANFINNTSSVPILATNLDLSFEPTLASLVKRSAILTVGNPWVSQVKVGVIGYVTPKTQLYAPTGKVIFLDEVSSIQEEVARLKENGVTILVALGHSGFNMDQRIAREVEDIDLVIGGHSHTFLYTGPHPSSEYPSGPYPTLVTQPSGRKVPVITAFSNTKYVGRLEVSFDGAGEMIEFSGNPVLMDGSVPQDPEVLSAIAPYRESIKVFSQDWNILGQTLVFLNGSRSECHQRECNMGNLITDAFVKHNAFIASRDIPGWTDASIAFICSGDIRGSINSDLNNGTITMEDLFSVLPYQTKMVKVQLKGKYLKEVLEHSVSNYDKTGQDLTGTFLQMSGVMVAFDLDKPDGERVKHALVRCSQCIVPRYLPIVEDQKYGLILQESLANGTYGYTMIRDHAERMQYDSSATDSEVVGYVINHYGLISTGLEARICLLNK